MKQNYDITPGTDKFLRLHIEELSKLTLNETKQRRPNTDRNLTPVVVSAITTGLILGIVFAWAIGLIP